MLRKLDCVYLRFRSERTSTEGGGQQTGFLSSFRLSLPDDCKVLVKTKPLSPDTEETMGLQWHVISARLFIHFKKVSLSDIRTILQNIINGFYMPTKLVGLLKTCLHKTYI
jgi:hypothetical protein